MRSSRLIVILVVTALMLISTASIGTTTSWLSDYESSLPNTIVLGGGEDLIPVSYDKDDQSNYSGDGPLWEWSESSGVSVMNLLYSGKYNIGPVSSNVSFTCSGGLNIESIKPVDKPDGGKLYEVVVKKIQQGTSQTT